MAKDGGSSGLSKDQELLDNKRKITELVRLKFARFGDEAVSIVLAYALQPVRMPILLERLELRISSPDLPLRLDAVCQWIFDNGPIHFKMRALAERKEGIKPIDLGPMPEHIPDMGAPPAPPQQPQSRQTPPPRDSRSSTPAPASPQARSGQYSGPDRRHGLDRRTDPDRRARLNAISKNKRFGGDRRKNPKGRRKDDQAKPDFWWRQLVYRPSDSKS